MAKMKELAEMLTLEENDGVTFKDFKPITYKTGYQVATEGYEARTLTTAVSAVIAYGGNCGVWYSSGIWYIDKSHRVNTKREALKIGRECKQQSVLQWNKMQLVWC